METQLGTPQGNSLSGLLYVIYQQKVLGLISQYTHQQGFAPVLRAVEDNSYRPPADIATSIPVIACYEGRNLMLNWSKLKSEVMMILPSDEIDAFHATVNTTAVETREGVDPSSLGGG
eukprot:6237438-Amphidinium_carterae.3